jgi:hypothetical protein
MIENETRRDTPSVAGAAAFLLSSLPLGIFWFVVLITLTCAGVPLMITWVGVPLTAFAVLLCRGAATLERARVYALLDTYIAVPYRGLPHGWLARWKARLADAATWRDFAYLILLLPLGIAEFTLVVTFWAVSIGYITLPIYFRFLPDGGYFFPDYTLRWISVDSTVDALPWTALGLLLLALTLPLTRALGVMHARFACALLAPAASRTGAETPRAGVLAR